MLEGTILGRNKTYAKDPVEGEPWQVCGAGRTSCLWSFFGSQLKPTRALYVNLIRSLTCSKFSYYSLLPRTSPPHHIGAHCYATNGLQGASNTDPSTLGPSILLHLLQSATQNQNDTNFLCALMIQKLGSTEENQVKIFSLELRSAL